VGQKGVPFVPGRLSDGIYIVHHVAAMHVFGLENLLSRLVSPTGTEGFIFIFSFLFFHYSLFQVMCVLVNCIMRYINHTVLSFEHDIIKLNFAFVY
jgi:hypothetical protein